MEPLSSGVSTAHILSIYIYILLHLDLERNSRLLTNTSFRKLGLITATCWEMCYLLDQVLRGRNPHQSIQEPNKQGSRVPVTSDANNSESMGRRGLGDRWGPDQDWLVPGTLHRGIPRFRRRRLHFTSGIERQFMLISRPLVECRELQRVGFFSEHSISKRQEEIYDLRLL